MLLLLLFIILISISTLYFVMNHRLCIFIYIMNKFLASWSLIDFNMTANNILIPVITLVKF